MYLLERIHSVMSDDFLIQLSQNAVEILPFHTPSWSNPAHGQICTLICL